jgi:hypothetical protein
MRTVIAKAVKLVNNGNVVVDLWHLDSDGVIDTASGRVASGDNLYWVTLAPDDSTCSCEWGQNRNGREHSHDLALRMAAQQEATE